MPRRYPSILSRIIWLHVLALAGIAIAVSAAAFLMLNATANDFEERMLQDHAVTVSRYLLPDRAGWAFDLPPDLLAIYSHGYGGYALAVVDGSGHAIYSSYARDSSPDAIDLRQSQPSFFRQRRGSYVYYGLNLPVMKGGRRAWIQLAQNLENPDVIVDDVVALFLRRIAWVVIPIFAILLAIDVLIMRRVMSPIVDASRAASAIGPNMSHARLPTEKLPREVLPLAQAVNQALTRLETGLQMQREFTTDAAHELRTPLAVLRTHIDTLLPRAEAQALRPDIDVMSRIVEQLLDLAELDSFAVSEGEPVDLNAVCSDVVGMMAPLALARDRMIEFTAGASPVWVCGNAEMLFRAVRNLVENAIRYTESGSSVEVEVQSPAILSVRDRGPGVPRAEHELIFRRFWRHDRQDKEHSGLGLAIVARTAQIHGGAVDVLDRPGGGAEFTMILPAYHPSKPIATPRRFSFSLS